MEKIPLFDYTGPFPFHHIAWSFDPIEVRLAWAKEALAAGADVNAVYTRSLDTCPRNTDIRCRPLAETIFWPNNYNKDTDTVEDLLLIALLLENGADPRLKDAQNESSCLDEARSWARAKGWEATHRYWVKTRDLMEAKALELDNQEAIARVEPPRGLIPRLKWQFGFSGVATQTQSEKEPGRLLEKEADKKSEKGQ